MRIFLALVRRRTQAKFADVLDINFHVRTFLNGYVFDIHFQGQTFGITLFSCNSKNVCTQINKFAIEKKTITLLDYRHFVTFV